VLNAIIRFLGGFSFQEYEALNSEYNNQRDLVSQYRAREERLENELKAEREERKFLQDLIFKRFGVIVSEGEPQSEENFQPIKTSPKRWSQLKNAMEEDDRMRVFNSGAINSEERIHAKEN
jgi:hypothetical protein